jgi:hypothetical protein
MTPVIRWSTNAVLVTQITSFNMAPDANGMIVSVRDTSATGSNTTFGGVKFNSSPGNDFLVGKRSTNTVGSFVVKVSGGIDLLTIADTGAVSMGALTATSGNLTASTGVWEMLQITNTLASCGALIRFKTPSSPANGYDVGAYGNTDQFVVRRNSTVILGTDNGSNNWNFQGNAVSMGALTATTGQFSAATNSTSSSTGTIILSGLGGIGVGGSIWAHGSIVSETGSINAQAGSVLGANFIGTVYLVSTLPANIAGTRAFVSDALAPTFGASVVGGGTVTVPVYADGASWKVG